MENSQQEVKTEQITPRKKVGGVSKKSSNKPSGNPMGGRNRAKSTVLSVFEKNLKANSQTTNNNNKIQVEGFDSERFKNLKAMFDKKPDERSQDEQRRQFGAGNMYPERLKAFAENNQNEENTKNSALEPIKEAPKMSIQDRIKMLMKSKEESQPKKTFDDPILEKLRENNLDEDEDSGDNYSEENLDISKEEDNHDDNNALDKSESLSEDGNKFDNIIDDGKEEKDNNHKVEEQRNKDSKENEKEDLDKSESLDD